MIHARRKVRLLMDQGLERSRAGRRNTDQLLGNLEGRLAGMVETMQRICEDCVRHQETMEKVSRVLTEHITYHRMLDQEAVKVAEKSKWRQQVALTTRTVLISASTTFAVLVITHFWK